MKHVFYITDKLSQLPAD